MKTQNSIWLVALMLTFQSPAKENEKVTVRGNVLSSEDSTLPAHEPGYHFKLRTDRGDLLIHVGPKQFPVEDKRITAGEPLTVVGVTISIGGQEEIRATKIKREIAGKK